MNHSLAGWCVSFIMIGLCGGFVFAEEEASEGLWSEPVRGLSVRLISDKQSYKTGEPVVLIGMIRNAGDDDIGLPEMRVDENTRPRTHDGSAREHDNEHGVLTVNGEHHGPDDYAIRVTVLPIEPRGDRSAET